MFPYDTMSGIPADSAIEQIRGLTTALQQAQAKRAQRQGRARIGAMVGSRLDPVETQAINDAAIATQAQRLGIDPRVALGDRAGRGMMQPPAAPTRAPMGRDVLAERLARMSGAGAKYQDGNVLPATRTRVEVRPDGRIALIGRAAMDPERAMPEGGMPTVRDRLMAARARRAAENAPRMLTSRNPAVREKGQALLDTMRGVTSQQGTGVDVVAAMAEANRIARMYGSEAGRAAFEAKMRQAQDDMERKSKTADLEKTLTSQEKVAGMRADSDLRVATDPRIVFMQGLQGGLTPEQAMERVRAMQAFTAGGTMPLATPPAAPASGIAPRGANVAPFANPTGSGYIVDAPLPPSSRTGATLNSGLSGSLAELLDWMRGGNRMMGAPIGG